MASTAMNDTPLNAKAHDGPSVAMITPPSAGPTARAALACTALDRKTWLRRLNRSASEPAAPARRNALDPPASTRRRVDGRERAAGTGRRLQGLLSASGQRTRTF